MSLATSECALIYDGSGLRLIPRSRPEAGPDQITVRVRAVGLCRTDLNVVAGRIKAKSPLIPGHEFAGTVAEVGAAVETDSAGDVVAIGDHVAINPVLPCGECRWCDVGLPADCQRPRFMGLDVDGACADFVAVPAAAVYRISAALPFTVAAFAEPVAACSAVLKTGIAPNDRGLICGDNRIARLTERILIAHGFMRVSVCTIDRAAELPDDEFDFVIETEASTSLLRQLVRLVRPRARIILKSRQHVPIALTLAEILPKEPVLHVANYGPFAAAVALLAERRIMVDDLIGTSYPMAEFRAAISAAGGGEANKTFLVNEA